MYNFCMWEENQKTLNSKISFSGIGLHSGANIDVTLIPSNSNSGITFKRSDLKKIMKLLQTLITFHQLSFVQKLKTNLVPVYQQ